MDIKNRTLAKKLSRNIRSSLEIMRDIELENLSSHTLIEVVEQTQNYPHFVAIFHDKAIAVLTGKKKRINNVLQSSKR